MDIDSVPPAIRREEVPVRIVWAPREMALREEAQTLFIVVQGTESGREAAREH